MPNILRNSRRLTIGLLHLGLIAASGYGAFWLRFGGAIPQAYAELWWAQVPWLLAIQGATFLALGLYDSLWRYTGIWDICTMAFGVGLSTALVGVELAVNGLLGSYPRSALVIDALLLGVAMVAIRIAPRVYTELSSAWRGRRVLVVGAGEAGAAIVREMKKTGDYRPVGFIDDDEAKHGTWIHGVQVLGGRHDLARILTETRAEEALVSIPRADPATVRRLVSAFEPFKIPIRTLPYLRDAFDGRLSTDRIRNLSIEDLLPRAPVSLKTTGHGALRQSIEGRSVLVTGAGGSIGSELCRQIATFNPSSLVLFERYENSLFALVNTLAEMGVSSSVRPVVGDVTDEQRVEAVLNEYRPELIFHAAAHKHVPLMEANPCEAIKNNVRGTRIMAAAAARHGVERFVLVSSDKAVYPTSIMGATKRVAEMIVQDLATRSDTRFLVVRFGNVLGSNGSVVPTFLRQIKAGGPVTVTHPEVRRYFMLIQEAVQLVLHASSCEESRGVYVLDMGEPIYLRDLARNAIRLCGFVPDQEIAVTFIGLRPGEKLSEDLVESDEVAERSHAANVWHVKSRRSVPPAWLAQRLALLEELAFAGADDRVKCELARTVPTFGQAASAPPELAVALSSSSQPAQEAPEDRTDAAAGRLVAVCAACGALEMRRSRTHSPLERLQKSFRRSRLYHCSTCGWRGWAQPVTPVEPYQLSEPVGALAHADFDTLEPAAERPAHLATEIEAAI